MSSLQRTITGDVLVQHLGPDVMTIDQKLLATHGRSARTLVKDGPLRLTIMALAAGGTLPPHSTDNPVSIQVVQGEVTFFALDEQYALAAGDVLILGAGVEHAARSKSGASFLLTVAFVPSPTDAERGSTDRTTTHAMSKSALQRWMDNAHDAGGPTHYGR